MTQNLPHESQLGYESRLARAPLPVRPTNWLILIVCWILILGMVRTVIVANTERADKSADTPTDNAAISAIGHCVIGAHAFAAADKSSQADATGPLVLEMDSVAKSPADRLRVAIISKEVQSATTANARLDALGKSDLPVAVTADLATLRIIYRDGPQAISQEQRQLLLDHEEWFGQIALNFGLSDNAPSRSQLIAGAKLAFVVTSVAMAVGFGGLLIGACLIVVAIVLAATGRLPLWFHRAMADSVFLESFTLYLTGFVLISVLLHHFVQAMGLGWSLVLTIMLPIAVTWPLVRGKTWAQTRLELGWHGGRGIFWEIGCGLVGYIAALPLLAMMLLITLGLIRISGANPSHPITEYLDRGPSEIVFIYFLACVWAPVFEESMFRGALFNHLRARHGWWVSASIVGLLFAAIHPQGWTTIPILGGIGMVLCALREWRSSLIASMAAHALSNGTVITLALLTSR